MNQHPCQDKCPNFTDEQCCHCLIAEVEQPEPEGCEHQLKLKQKQAALKQLLENDDAAIH